MKPILFTDEMVRAILDGRKTKTRRPLKPQPDSVHDGAPYWNIGGYRAWEFLKNPPAILRKARVNTFKCPFGKVGDRLWVRETFCLEHQVESDQPPPFTDGRPIRWEFAGMESDPEGADMWLQPHYRATDPTPELAYEDTDGEPTVRWKPSLHMPRWASRITLEITDVRVERVQEIMEEEATAEGVLPRDGMTAVYWFSEAWDFLHGKAFPWESNPWVWCVTFRPSIKDGSHAVVEGKGDQNGGNDRT